MDLSPQLTDELHELLWQLRAGAASPEQSSRLERLVCDDPQARAFYVRYMHLCADLHWNCVESAEHEERSLEIGDSGFGVRDFHVPNPKSQIPNQQIPSLSTLHSPLSTNFVGSPLFSYIAATLILGVMLLGAWAYKITHDYGPSHVKNSFYAKNSRGSTTPGLSTPPRPAPVFVARITGMKDCRWADPATETYAGAYVPLGRKYVLSSGLMEITYLSGAKVILEGPCTYEVESTAGGFLVLGKLAARVESAKQRPKTQDPSPKTEISKSPNLQISKSLFSVRTPTAVVTDLGTEFGVEVTSDGDCEVHLIEGRVVVGRTGGGKQDAEVLLAPGQAIRFASDQTAPDFITPNVERFRAMREGLVSKRKLTWPILDKTFVAWVSLANLSQQGGGVISIEQPETHEFDGIVYAELAPRKWMVASDYHHRAQNDQSATPDETTGPQRFIQIAIVYKLNRVTIFRDGEIYADYWPGWRQTFTEESIVLMGKRCMDRTWLDPPHYPPTLAGAIEEARLYDVALTAKGIAALKPNEPSPIKPAGLWTFEDGTARDAAGNFPPGELRGNARIEDGKLILDGRDGYLFVPAATDKNAETPVKQNNNETMPFDMSSADTFMVS